MVNQLKFNDKLKIIGLMSGTSCDGLDIALIEINGSGKNSKINFIVGKSINYSSIQKDVIQKAIDSTKCDTQYLSQLNFYLPQIWSEMISEFLKINGIDSSEIDLIGSHGQTIWHQPKKEEFAGKSVSSTLQAGDPAVLAQLTGIPVIGDFRVADVALDGQGAPLIPYFDWVYFSQFNKNILSVNIGGISNFTFIPSDGDINKGIAFDCGPGNLLIDSAMQNIYNKPFDKDGKTATSGKLSDKLFDYIKSIDNFVESIPPKSTGREYYNQLFLNNILQFASDNKIEYRDIINTLSDYSAYSIFQNYKLFVEPHSNVESVVVAGGGAHNSFIINDLQEYYSPINVVPVSEYGLDINLKEAIGFAVLANETVKGNPSNISQATGASKPAILGKICLV